MHNTNEEPIRWRPFHAKKVNIKKIKPDEKGALKTLAMQLIAESRGDDIPLQEVAERTPIPLERLKGLALSGYFPTAYFIHEDDSDEQVWYVPISDLQG